MSTLKINSTGSASRALDYAGNERRPLKHQTYQWLRAHDVSQQALDTINGRVVRKAGANGLVVFATPQLGADTPVSDVKQAFKVERQRTHQNSSKNQAVRIIQSFAHAELDPTNPTDWQRANDLGVKLIEQAYPDYQAAVYTHLDSKNHNVHNHIIVSRINQRTGRKLHDRHAGDSLTHLRNINDNLARQQGWSILQRDKPVTINQTQRDLAHKGVPSYVSAIQRQALGLILNPKIKQVSDFDTALHQQGVQLTVRGNKAGNLSFRWTDSAGKKRQVRGKRLGTLFTRDNLAGILALPRAQRIKKLQQLGAKIPPQAAPQPVKQATQNQINQGVNNHEYEQRRVQGFIRVATVNRYAHGRARGRLRGTTYATQGIKQRARGVNQSTQSLSRKVSSTRPRYQQLASQLYASLQRQSKSLESHLKRLARTASTSYTKLLHQLSTPNPKVATGSLISVLQHYAKRQYDLQRQADQQREKQEQYKKRRRRLRRLRDRENGMDL